MEFPNVLAFEAEAAVKILREAGYECSIIVTEPPKFKDRLRRAALANMWLDSASWITIKQKSRGEKV